MNRDNLSLKNRSFSEILMLLPNLIASLLDLIFCIPIFGRVFKWIWNSLITLVHIIFGLVEYLLWTLGYRPVKKFGIGFLVLRDQNGEPLITPEEIMPAVQKAQEIFDQANVQIIPAFPRPKKLSESGDLPESSTWVRTLRKSAASRILEVDCNLPAMLQDLGLPGTQFQFETLGAFFQTSVRRLTGYGAPVTVFVVKNIGKFTGCSLGWLSDYVTVKHDHIFTTAHELGHACNLLHMSDRANLMHPSSGKQKTILLETWQIALLRASRHITFF
ncbi:MAG: hypothetical protein GWN62_07115 [Aliifodinibius sp.]|nr:hypothetical protein [Fodinibius sp.]